MTHSTNHRVARSAFAVIVAALFTASISGCGPTPQSVVVKFFDKIQKNDFTGAKKYCTESFGNRFNSADSMNSMMGGNPFAGQPTLTEADFECEIQGTTARVRPKGAGMFFSIVLEKPKWWQNWKIDRYDMDFSGLQDMMQNLPEDVRRQMGNTPQMPQGH
jgi:hypothetical protein